MQYIPANYGNDVTWVYCTDVKTPLPAPWQRMYIRPQLPPRLESRRCKALSHQLFPSADVTIWHGGNVQLTRDPVGMLRYVDDVDIAVKGHPRDTIYDEAAACSRMGKDSPRIISNQVAAYHAEGCPGKMYGAFLIIRRNTPAISRFNEVWWEQTQGWSMRDQIGLGYALWKCGIVPEVIQGTHRNGPDYKRYPHSRTS